MTESLVAETVPSPVAVDRLEGVPIGGGVGVPGALKPPQESWQAGPGVPPVQPPRARLICVVVPTSKPSERKRWIRLFINAGPVAAAFPKLIEESVVLGGSAGIRSLRYRGQSYRYKRER